MKDIELLLTDEFVEFSSKIASLHEKRKKTFSEFKSTTKDLESRVSSLVQDWGDGSHPDPTDELSRTINQLEGDYSTSKIYLTDRFIQFASNLSSLQKESKGIYKDFKTKMVEFDNRARQIHKEWDNWKTDQVMASRK